MTEEVILFQQLHVDRKNMEGQNRRFSLNSANGIPVGVHLAHLSKHLS